MSRPAFLLNSKGDQRQNAIRRRLRTALNAGCMALATATLNSTWLTSAATAQSTANQSTANQTFAEPTTTTQLSKPLASELFLTSAIKRVAPPFAIDLPASDPFLPANSIPPSTAKLRPNDNSQDSSNGNSQDVSNRDTLERSGPVQSAGPGPQPDRHDAGISLDSLEALALTANPSIARASAAVAAARGAALQAGLKLNPTVGYEGQQIGSRGQAEQHGIAVGQEFLRNEKRTLSREVACREVQMAEFRLVADRARVLTDVRMAFYRTVRAQRQIDMSADLLRIADQARRTADALFNAKEVARTDLLQAEIEVTEARTALETARSQHQSAWSQLSAVCGQPVMAIATLHGDLFAPPNEIDFESVLAWIRLRSPEVAEAVTDIQRARLFLQRQIVEPRPNLSIQALYNFVDNGIGGQPDAAVAVSVPVPVHNRNQGAIQQARYQVVVSEQALAQLELSMQQRLAPVFQRYSSSKQQMMQYGKHILPTAAESLRLTQIAFEAGEIGFINLLVVQRSYRQQQIAYLESAETLRLAEAEIDGLLLTGSLTARP